MDVFGMDGGIYRTRKNPNNMEKAKKQFVRSLVNKGYSARSAKMLFAKEEKKPERILTTRKYQHMRKARKARKPRKPRVIKEPEIKMTYQQYRHAHAHQNLGKKVNKWWKDYKSGKRADGYGDGDGDGDGGFCGVGRRRVRRSRRHNLSQLTDWRMFLEDYKNRIGWSPSSHIPYKVMLRRASNEYHK